MNGVAVAVNAAFLVARALVPLFGVLFLDWAAPKVLVVYLADTAATYYGYLARLAVAAERPSQALPHATPDRIARASRTMLRALVVPIPTLLLLGFFFGILPLFVMLEIQDIRWPDLLADRAMWQAVALQFVLAVWAILQRTSSAPVGKDDPATRLLAAGLALRWVVMIFVGFFVPPLVPRRIYGPLLVAVYAAMTAALELAPARVVAWARRIVS